MSGTGDFGVAVAAGSLRAAVRADLELPHRWTPEGVVAQVQFTGVHLLHLAAAGCVLNDVYREAGALEVPVQGVLVRAAGTYDTDAWRCEGVVYEVEVDSPSSPDDVARLLAVVDEVAEVPRVLRAGAPVSRLPQG